MIKLSKNTHSKGLEQIASNPENFGIVDFGEIEIEKSFYNRRGKQLGEADLIIHNKYDSRIAYVVEYKCHDSTKGRFKAAKQLKKAQDSLKDLKVVRLFYIHDNTESEILINDIFYKVPNNHDIRDIRQSNIDNLIKRYNKIDYMKDVATD